MLLIISVYTSEGERWEKNRFVRASSNDDSDYNYYFYVLTWK